MPTPITDPDLLAQLNAPARAPVASSPRVWGDQEAQSAGLYEQPRKPVTDPGLLQQLNGNPSNLPPETPGIPRITIRPRDQVEYRTPPEGDYLGSDELRKGLQNKAASMTTGAPASAPQQMATNFQNTLDAAMQGTSPNVDQYKGRMVSNQVFENDAGEIQYRDPSTGQIVSTNSQRHVVIRDPADNTLKVYDRSEDTNENAAVGVARVLAPGLASGAATARPAIPTKNVIPQASDTFSTAKPYYRAFTQDAGGIGVPAETAQVIGERLTRALDRIGLDPEMGGAPAVSAIKRLTNPQEEMTLDYLQRVKRVAQRGFNSPDKNQRDAAAALTGEISKVIAEVSPGAAANLKKADAIHSTAMAQQELQRKGEIAGLRTGRAGYGGNAVNSMRQVISPIVQKAIEGRKTSFKPDEIAVMREFVEGDGATNFLRAVGQLSPSKGIMATAVGGATAGTTAVVGAAANKLANVLTGKQLDRLKELVAKRSPAYEVAVTKAVERYERAQAEFGSQPTPGRFAAYLTASRSLSNGLTRDGIPVSSGDLLRGLQGPVRAEQDQQ